MEYRHNIHLGMLSYSWNLILLANQFHFPVYIFYVKHSDIDALKIIFLEYAKK